MSSFRLIESNCLPDFSCPHCDAQLEIDEWFTEYGQVILGDHEAVCPACEEDLTFEVHIQYSSVR